MSAALLACRRCYAAVAEQDLFCEGCGTDLVAEAPVPPDSVPAASVPAASVPPVSVPVGGVAAASEAVTTPVSAVGGGPVVRIDQPDLTVRPVRCAQCGGSIATDGYCEHCGHPAPVPRDHWTEQPASWVAAVSDRGVRHPHNEDAVAVAAADTPGSFAVLVVCDGVSSSVGSDVASLAAVRTARNLLVAAAQPGPERPGAGVESTTLAAAGPPGVALAGSAAPATVGIGGSESGADEPGADEPGSYEPGSYEPGSYGSGAAGPGAAGDLPGPAGLGHTPSARSRSRAGSFASRIVEAGLQANAAVVACAGDPPRPNPPSCTFVCALVEDGLLVAGWVGDSRVYWLPDDGRALQISSDDSWAGEAVAAGIPREDAERAPQAHAITRWFGVDAPDPRAHTVSRLLEGPGWVLVCSDGLWNYCSPAAELQGLVALTMRRTGTDPARLAGELVAWATEQGGHDNITVALARVQ